MKGWKKKKKNRVVLDVVVEVELGVEVEEKYKKKSLGRKPQGEG